MAKAYYGTRISDNMTKTPEGYLICHNVPLSRTGWYEYAASEVGLDGDELVKVYRSPEEVFDPAAIASFEGKTVTDSHPSQYPVAADNEGAYSKGHAQNVRKGSGDLDDCMLGDLFVKDAVLINKIENGVREVSCGYDCEWVPMDDGTYQQRKIRGNHIAVVPNGRAGDRVSIRDEAPQQTTKRGVTMPFDWKKIFGIGFKEWVKDAEPEAVASAIEAAKKGEERAEDCFGKGKDAFPIQGGGAGGEGGEGGGESAELAILKQIQATLQQLVQSDKQVHSQLPQDTLDALEKELSEGDDGEGGEKKKEGEQAEDELSGGVPTLSEEEKPKNPIPGADSKQAILTAIRTMKPIIAAIQDEKQRKAATDALAKSFKDMMRPGGQKATYGDLLRPKQALDKQAQDRAAADENYGRNIKEKFHRKVIVGGK
ncbi:MAG: hypothetical protein A4E65_00336 [Syntrophorhabdus sp. PtaU1.Bin153]|nr:MAG: hypothetical protein A4E65_00336 [Syntrophorhabdus sp. PtaU1.Bin153]